MGRIGLMGRMRPGWKAKAEEGEGGARFPGDAFVAVGHSLQPRRPPPRPTPASQAATQSESE
jgi:hypothetical protein